jgi:hypothetical protein
MTKKNTDRQDSGEGMPLILASPALNYSATRTEVLRQCSSGEPYALAVNSNGNRYFMQFRECKGIRGGIRFAVSRMDSNDREMTREDFETAMAILKENPPKNWTKHIPQTKDKETADDFMILANLEFRALELKKLGR